MLGQELRDALVIVAVIVCFAYAAVGIAYVLSCVVRDARDKHDERRNAALEMTQTLEQVKQSSPNKAHGRRARKDS